MRQPGYYWVWVDDKKEIAEWCDELNWWTFLGTTMIN